MEPGWFHAVDVNRLHPHLLGMRIYYVTLNTADETHKISHALLERQLAVCTNWFPITGAYRREGKIVEESETVLEGEKLPSKWRTS